MANPYEVLGVAPGASDDEIKKFSLPTLTHNREILTPLDDSVVTVNNGKMQFIRRARGYVPLSIDIGKRAKCDTLLMGGDLKSLAFTEIIMSF